MSVLLPRTWCDFVKAMLEAAWSSWPRRSGAGYPGDPGLDRGDPRSVLWRLAPDGIRINGTAAIGAAGLPQTVEVVWARFGDDICAWATDYDVPVELIVATICTERNLSTTASACSRTIPRSTRPSFRGGFRCCSSKVDKRR